MITKKIDFSYLELAMVSLGNTFKQTLNETLVMAKEVESQGYKRIWFAEHHNAEHIGSSATSVLMGYAAENTKTIRVGSGGIMLPNHSPLIIAEQFGTLAQLYPDRIDLGVGRAAGTDAQTAQAIRSDFFQATRSFPEEIKKIQTYFSPENKHAKIRVSIAEGMNVPIYILGSSQDSAHLAAKEGFPYAFASHFATAQLHNALEIYKREFQPSDALSKPYTIAGINMFAADTDEEANRLFTSQIRMIVTALTSGKGILHPPMDMDDELRGLLQHPSVHQMLKYSFVGSKQTVKKQIKDFLEETGVDELIIVSPTFYLEDRLKSIRLFAEIMNEINENK